MPRFAMTGSTPPDHARRNRPDFFRDLCRDAARPTVRAGDVVILDNPSSHEGPKAAYMLREVGAWFLFLPPYSPDLNPIEKAFSKLKALIRMAAARTYDDLWRAVGNLCDLFSARECENDFTAAGYGGD